MSKWSEGAKRIRAGIPHKHTSVHLPILLPVLQHTLYLFTDHSMLYPILSQIFFPSIIILPFTFLSFIYHSISLHRASKFFLPLFFINSIIQMLLCASLPSLPLHFSIHLSLTIASIYLLIINLSSYSFLILYSSIYPFKLFFILPFLP